MRSRLRGFDNIEAQMPCCSQPNGETRTSFNRTSMSSEGSPKRQACGLNLLELTPDCLRIILRLLTAKDLCSVAIVCSRLAEFAQVRLCFAAAMLYLHSRPTTRLKRESTLSELRTKRQCRPRVLTQVFHMPEHAVHCRTMECGRNSVCADFSRRHTKLTGRGSWWRSCNSSLGSHPSAACTR